jgi:hypothetical protein
VRYALLRKGRKERAQREISLEHYEISAKHSKLIKAHKNNKEAKFI